MLQNIRDKTQGWITRVITGLVCAAFVLWGVHSFMASSGPAQGFLARVNGQDISQIQFEAAYQRLLQEQQAKLGPDFNLTPSMQMKMKEAALEQLVTTTALAQAAEKQHFRFTPTQVGSVVGSSGAFQDNGHFSSAKFTQLVRSLGYSETEFFDNIRQAMLINQLRVGIVASSFSLPWEVKQINNILNQTRDVVFVKNSPNAYASQVKISSDDIQAYYQKHQDQFTTPQTVVLQYLSLNLADIAQNISAAPADVQQYYQTNMDRYAKAKSFAEVKDKVRQDYIQDKATHVFSDKLDQLNNLTYTNPQTLEPAAKALGATIQTSDALTPDAEGKGIFANPQVKQAAFSKDVLAGNNSAPVNIDDAHVVVIRLLTQHPSAVKPLSAVQSQIQTILKQQKMQELATAAAQAMLSDVMSGKFTLPQAAAKANLKVSTQNNISQRNAARDPISLYAFQLPRPSQRASVGMFRLASGELLVMQVVKASPDNPEASIDEVQQRVMDQQITNAYAQLEYQIYVNGVMNAANIRLSDANRGAA